MVTATELKYPLQALPRPLLSSCHASNTNLPNPFSSPASIVHRSREVFQAISCIDTELLYISSSWSSYFGRPAFARSCEGVHKSISLMSSPLLFQQCPACLLRLTLIVFAMGGRWPYSCSSMGSCFQDLFNTARNIQSIFKKKNTQDLRIEVKRSRYPDYKEATMN